MRTMILLLTFASLLPLPGGDRPAIRVLGVAEERVPPDQLQLSCSIRTEGEKLAEVAAANRERAAEVTRLLRDQGLGETELRTGPASFGEHTEYRDGRHIKLGYVATTSISVATDKLDLHDKLWFELSKFPEVSVSAGFEIEDRAAVRATARGKALKAARAKADEMAAALDARIGAPLEITENPARNMFATSNMIGRNSIDAVLADPAQTTPLEPGLIPVVETVEVVFELIE